MRTSMYATERIEDEEALHQDPPSNDSFVGFAMWRVTAAAVMSGGLLGMFVSWGIGALCGVGLLLAVAFSQKQAAPGIRPVVCDSESESEESDFGLDVVNDDSSSAESPAEPSLTIKKRSGRIYSRDLLLSMKSSSTTAPAGALSGLRFLSSTVAPTDGDDSDGSSSSDADQQRLNNTASSATSAAAAVSPRREFGTLSCVKGSFGFISALTRTTDAFFHISELQAGSGAATAGARVSFLMQLNSRTRKYNATCVVVVSEEEFAAATAALPATASAASSPKLRAASPGLRPSVLGLPSVPAMALQAAAASASAPSAAAAASSSSSSLAKLAAGGGGVPSTSWRSRAAANRSGGSSSRVAAPGASSFASPSARAARVAAAAEARRTRDILRAGGAGWCSSGQFWQSRGPTSASDNGFRSTWRRSRRTCRL